MKTESYIFALIVAGTSVLFAQEKEPIMGADKDAQGCIASAGYTYSQLKKECIRTFEQKIQLKEIASKGNYNATVLFNRNQSKAEIFLKEEKKSVILNRTSKGIWKNTPYILKKNTAFVLFKKKEAIYASLN
jgi:hypothetical protein